MFPRNLPFDSIEDADRLPVNRIKNLLGDPWNPDPDATNTGRNQPAGARISTEAQFRRAAKAVLDRHRREEEALEFLPSRKPTPQLIGTTTPTTPPRKPITPWWQSGGFEDIGGAAHSENSRQVDAILKSSDTGGLPLFIADALDTGANQALAEVSNLFKQLNDRAPERAEQVAQEVRAKVSAKTGHKLDGLEGKTVQVTKDKGKDNVFIGPGGEGQADERPADKNNRLVGKANDKPVVGKPFTHDFSVVSDNAEKEEPASSNGYAHLVIGAENDLLAAKQRTSPHLTTIRGEYRYTTAPESVQGSFRKHLQESGRLRNPDPEKYVVLRDPADGEYRVWNRSEKTAESTLLGAARVFTGSALPTLIGKAGKAISVSKAGTAGRAAKSSALTKANQAFGQWVSKITKPGQNAINETVRLGELTPEIWGFLKSKNVSHSSTDILVRDKEIQHMLRDVKKARGQAISEDMIGRMPEAIANPKAVLWDKKDPALLYVFDAPGETRKGKFVVRVDMRDKIRPLNSTSSEKVKSNFVRTGGLVQSDALSDIKQYEKIIGIVE